MCDKHRLLNEARGQIFTGVAFNGLVGTVKETSRRNAYSATIVSNDGHPIATECKDFIIYELFPRKITKYYQENRTSIAFSMDLSSKYAALGNLSTTTLSLDKYKEVMAEYISLGLAKRYEAHDVATAIKIITTKIKLPPYVAETWLGKTLEQHVQADLKIGTASVIFRESLRDNTRSDIQKLLYKADSVFKANGIEKLMTGIISVQDIPLARTMGLYYIGTRTILISPKARYSDDTLHTIIHEFGHKWFYEFVDPKMRAQITDDYAERIKVPSSMPDAVASSDPLLWRKFTPDSVIEYVGPKRTFKKLSPFKVLEASPSHLIIVSTTNSKQSLSGRPAQFASDNWIVDGQPVSERVTKASEFKDAWFPSNYSKTNASEWYAELFAYYLLDHFGNPEIKAYIKATLS